MAGPLPRERDALETIVRATARRPAGADGVLRELEAQLVALPDPRQDGLEELASALALALASGAERALPSLARLAAEHPGQPLCQLYHLGARREAGDPAGARAALAALARADPDDPMVELLGLGLDGAPPPAISEERRLANIARFASTPLLSNPYRLAVGALFGAIRDVEHARVLDIGVGSGAQMRELLRLLGRGGHRVRRLDVVGLDLVDGFLATAGAALAPELAPGVEVTYVPVAGRIEALDEAAAERILAGGPLDAANATIALHEVPGEAKLAALRAIRRLAPGRLVLAEWNYCLENVLPETGLEFLLNIRSATTGMIAALRERHTLGEARAVARDWMSLAEGQLTCPASERQECFLDAATWRALLEHCGFAVARPDPALLDHVDEPAQVVLEDWCVLTAAYAGRAPIVLMEAIVEGG